MKNKEIGKAVASIISAPVGLCTCKVAMDIAANILPAPVGTPLKIAYKVGTIGIGILGDYAISKCVENTIDDVCDAMEETKNTIEKTRKQEDTHLKRMRA